MQIYARQGDIIIKRIENISGPLCQETDVVVAGSDSPHTIRGPVQIQRAGDSIIRVRITTETVVFHAGRHEDVRLETGDYELQPLRERGDRRDRRVED